MKIENGYKVYTAEELAHILKEHAEWLIDSDKGCMADLRLADLSSADLRSANLRSADLRSANLRSADLSSADLRSANLRSADLSSADLSWANLRSADLRTADLSSADLRSADLRSANLSWADLRSADLRSANLDKKYYQISRIGSRKDITTYSVEENIIFCGCWKGTIEEFEKRVKETHKDNSQYLNEYLNAIKFFKAMSEEINNERKVGRKN